MRASSAYTFPAPCLHRSHVEDNHLCGVFYFKGNLVPLPPCPAAAALAPFGAFGAPDAGPEGALGTTVLFVALGLVLLFIVLSAFCCTSRTTKIYYTPAALN